MKRCKELRSLSSDHHSALVLAKHILEAGDGGLLATAWKGVQQRFALELEPHFKLEEEALLPALLRAGENALVARTLDEHAEMRRLIHSEADADVRSRLSELLRSHVRFEERELFEIAQRCLSAPELERIGLASGNGKRSCSITKETQ